MIETPPIDPPTEGCLDAAAAQWFTAPGPLVEPRSESRLVQVLRDAAKTKQPNEILIRSAVAHYRNGPEIGNALADLAVTGREAYAAFQRAPVGDATLIADTTERLVNVEHVRATAEEIAIAVSAALDRAFAVAWALRGPAAQRHALREDLGWIAVSGEDDKPHRPVNERPLSGASPPFEQFDISVTTAVPGPPANNLSVRTRFLIASAADNLAPAAILPSPRTLPPDPVPHIPAGHQVILFIPCKSFRIQESRLARQEIYDANFRQWHWRVACEQLIFSHDDHVDHDDTKPWRYEFGNVP